MRNFTACLFFTVIFFAFQLQAQTPLAVYTETNYTGSTQAYPIYNTYTNLGAFDNAIKSFTLQQGYMATFATSSDGTGYSRVFRADDGILQIPDLSVESPYLNGTISFIRVMALHDYVTKKGWAGWYQDEWTGVNASWRYDWSAGGSSGGTLEYVPIKQNLGWPSWGEIEGKPNITHVLGYNEPDRPDQSNIPREEVIANWKYFMKSGLRVGSPAHSDPYNGLWGFMAEAEANNFRVDFIAIHSYWSINQQNWSWRLDDVWNAFKRPIWITEWNNGANWTTESWPSGNRLATDANVAKQLGDITSIINILESKPYVERYSFYNAVEDCRAAVLTIDDCWKSNNPNWQSYQWLQTALQNLDNEVLSTWSAPCYENGPDVTRIKVLTPTGQYLRDLVSAKAFNPATEYVPTWKPFQEKLTYTISEDFQNVILHWEGLNGELINNYIVERRLSGETSWSSFYNSPDYTVLSALDALPSYALYHLKTLGKDDAETTSAQIAVSVKSLLAAVPVSAKKIDLSWSNVENAVSYNIRRATSSGGTYELVASNVVGTSYQDTGLNPNTTYYYKIWPVGTGGESGFSSPEAMATTFTMEAPNGAVQNILVGSGDNNVKLKWDFIQDSQFDIKRSTSPSGPFSVVGTTDFDAASFTDLTAVNGTTYYYTITAFNDAGTSPDSDVSVANPDLNQHVYFDFNDSFGTDPYDQWGIYDATLMPAAGLGSGKGGGGIDLTGTDDSFMQIENGVVKDLTDFTIATWVKLDAKADWARIFDFGSDTNKYMFLAPQHGTNKYLYFALTINSYGDEDKVETTYSPPVGQWFHVAVTLEGTDAKIYVNGNLVGQNTVPYRSNPTDLGNTTQNYIGKSQFPDALLDGAIDEFRIYNRAFNATEIMNLAVEDVSVPVQCPYVPLYSDKTNLTPDPEMNNFNLYYSWGSLSNETADVYCGTTSLKVNGKCGGSADIKNINWAPNTKYRVKFAAKTIGGNAVLGVSNGGGVANLTFDKPTWGIVDYTFETGATVSQGLVFINSCESGATATTILIDNLELYQISESSDPLNNEECAFVPLYAGEPNLAPNRACDNLSAYDGWPTNSSLRSVVTDNVDARCGDYIKLITNGGCNAALDINNVAWAPNATYRIHVYIKTIGGSVGFITTNTDPNVEETFDTGGEWQLIDYSFTTGPSPNPNSNFLSINGCDGPSEPDATEVWIDDFELYRTDTILGVEDHWSNVSTQVRAIGNRIYVSNVTSATEINMYSITGALVKTLKTNIDTDFEFKTGLWIATIKTAEGQKSQKLLVR